jgi:hypothetical protein
MKMSYNESLRVKIVTLSISDSSQNQLFWVKKADDSQCSDKTDL